MSCPDTIPVNTPARRAAVAHHSDLRREAICSLTDLGWSVRKLARLLKLDPSTITRALAKGPPVPVPTSRELANMEREYAASRGLTPLERAEALGWIRQQRRNRHRMLKSLPK